MKFGIIREGKTPPDKRVAFTPKQCAEIQNSFGVDVVVESSTIRAYSDDEYIAEGIKVSTDLSDCDILFGVKEVPIEMLIPNKTYFFFSHTIKKQSYNRKLLKALVDDNITLVDYETLTNTNGVRLAAFGRYAGIVGAYNGLRAAGERSGKYSLRPAHECSSRAEMESELDNIKLPEGYRIIVTGGGRVGGGVLEVLHKAGIRQVFPKEYLTSTFEEPVCVQLHVEDYNERIDGEPMKRRDFYDHPVDFKSCFMKYAARSNMYIPAHYWDPRSPFIFSRKDAKSPDFKIDIVADISCDIDSAVASTIRPSTIAEPFYGYDPENEIEVPFTDENSIGVMAVDNLPCELPRDASEDFGNELIKNVIPALFNGDVDAIIKRATIVSNNNLTEKYNYLEDYLAGQE